MRTLRATAMLLSLLATVLALGPVGASAYRAPVTDEVEQPEELLEVGPLPAFQTEKQIEGACGVAVRSATHDLFVADYYHHAVHTYTVSGTYLSSLFLAGGSPPIVTPNSVCGLAVDGAGTRYAAEYHQRVLRLPDEAVIDPGHATGIAVDDEGDLYVNDRTYVAVYDAPVEPGESPASKIGVGNLEDAYGVAVDSQSGRVYVPDAAGEVVKVFEPAVDPAVPVEALAPPGGFRSLVDASLTVDESATEGDGHVLVVDDLKPGLDFPLAAVYEFDGDGAFLDTLVRRSVGQPGVEHPGPIFGEPSGIAVDSTTGDLFVTTGNSAFANIVKYGPYQPVAPATPAESGGSPVSGAAVTAPVAAGEGHAQTETGSAAASVVEQRRGVRVSFDGKLTPHALPRHGTAPVGIVVDASIGATGGDDPPQLRRISIAINRNGHFTSQGLPVCRVEQIQPSTTENALAACRRSLVGEGNFSANVKLPQQSPFPSSGKVLAFNGKINGRPAILAHIYGTKPAPTSTVLPFILRKSHGTYGTTLETSLPQATGNWGYVTGLRMSLRRSFNYRGRSRSFLSAGCPAPPGFPSASFPLAKTSFAFAGDLTIKAVLTRSCKARG